jgi:hypothetical protein
MHYSMTNPIKEPILEQLVHLLRINVKMDRKASPPMASIPISFSSVISSIVAPTKKIHHVAAVHQ